MAVADKNPNYWRRDAEREAMTRKHERRVKLASSALRAERHELADAVAPVAPLLGDGGELVDLAAALAALDCCLIKH